MTRGVVVVSGENDRWKQYFRHIIPNYINYSVLESVDIQTELIDIWISYLKSAYRNSIILKINCTFNEGQLFFEEDAIDNLYTYMLDTSIYLISILFSITIFEEVSEHDMTGHMFDIFYVNNTFYYYDPGIDNYKNIFLLFCSKFKDIDKTKNIIVHKTNLNKTNVQQKEILASKNYDIIDKEYEGYCLIWSMFFIHAVLNYYNEFNDILPIENKVIGRVDASKYPKIIRAYLSYFLNLMDPSEYSFSEAIEFKNFQYSFRKIKKIKKIKKLRKFSRIKR